ncbi:hypothetical protein [Plantactinospora sp. BB1]|uniref:hypothetical protein n=1 Tax=Plantactinospora sp. BB1 TaxID=2071627 RepID=UPI000D15D8FE|nr:hypothetical protein [Plantactinospora sp. BB1]AVT40347.1 hypothetical protein C6W10_32210 [Plantactinospora sp. BB1]
MPTPLVPLTCWPGPASTGVPPNTVLTRSGPLDLRRDGQVISNLHITGRVSVHARNVTIRRSRITSDGATFPIRTFDSAVNLVVEDVEIDGRGRSPVGVCFDDYTLRRVNLHHVQDGLWIGSRVTVVDSWIHDLVRVPGSHNDCVRVVGVGDVLIRHNRLDAYRPSTAEAMNSCLSLGLAVQNLRFEENYCDGGSYTIGIRPDLAASAVLFRGNVFGRHHRTGIVARPTHPGVTWEKSNVWFDNGRPVGHE